MRTMRLALSFVAIATQGVFAKEMAIVNCNDSFLIIQQDITEQGMRVFRCGGQGPACITSDDCQVGTCAPGASLPDCAGSLKVLFKHGYKLAFVTPQPVTGPSTNPGLGNIIYTLEK